MSNITDTIMNIEIFAFIGVLIWLYLKPVSIEKPGTGGEKAGKSGAEPANE